MATIDSACIRRWWRCTKPKRSIRWVAVCPIVVQIPVFIALYWTLLLSVELRQAPFALWIHDLVAAGPLLHPAGPDGGDHVHPDVAQSHSARSHAGEADEDHAGRVQRLLLLLPVGLGAVLAGQQHSVHCPAVAYHARARAGKDRSWGNLTSSRPSRPRLGARRSASFVFRAPDLEAVDEADC